MTDQTMFGAMKETVVKSFNAMSTLADATNNAAETVNNFAKYGREASEVTYLEGKAERVSKLKELDLLEE